MITFIKTLDKDLEKFKTITIEALGNDPDNQISEANHGLHLLLRLGNQPYGLTQTAIQALAVHTGCDETDIADYIMDIANKSPEDYQGLHFTLYPPVPPQPENQYPQDKIDERIKELEAIPEDERHPLGSYELMMLKALQPNYDDTDDLTNILKALHEVYDIIYEQRYIYLKQRNQHGNH